MTAADNPYSWEQIGWSRRPILSAVLQTLEHRTQTCGSGSPPHGDGRTAIETGTREATMADTLRPNVAAAAGLTAGISVIAMQANPIEIKLASDHNLACRDISVMRPRSLWCNDCEGNAGRDKRRQFIGVGVSRRGWTSASCSGKAN